MPRAAVSDEALQKRTPQRLKVESSSTCVPFPKFPFDQSILNFEKVFLGDIKRGKKVFCIEVYDLCVLPNMYEDDTVCIRKPLKI